MAAISGHDAVSLALIGEAGIGKTAFMHQVLAHIGAQRHVVYIHPSSLTERHPYGALTFLLGDFEYGATPHPVQVISTLAKTFREQARTGTTIVAVEDAHHLDEFSSIILHELARSGTIQMLLASRDFTALPTGISSLWRDGLLRRIDLEPMDVEACRKYLECELEAVVSTTVLETLAKDSGGTPRFLWAMCHDLRETQQLTQQRGVWTLQPGIVTYGRRTADAMSDVVDDCSKAAKEIIDLLSLAGSLPLLLLLRISSGTDVDLLEERGVLAIEQRREHMVRLKSEYLGRSGSWRLGAGRRWELYKKLLAVVGSENELPLEALWHAQWITGYGGTLPSQLAYAAAYEANRSGKPALALQVAERSREKTPGVVAETVTAMTALGDYRDAEAVLKESEASCVTDDVAGWVAQMTAEVRLLMHTSPTEARQVLQGIERSLQPALKFENLSPGPLYSHQAVTLVRAELASFEGRFPDNAEALPEVYKAAASESINLRAQVGSWLCEAWALTDRQDESIELASELQRFLADPTLTDVSASMVRQRVAEVCYLTGAPAGGPALPTEEVHGDAIPQYPGAIPADLMKGIVNAHRGSTGDAQRILLPVMRQLQTHDAFAALPLATAVMAYCWAVDGWHEDALRILNDQPPQAGSWNMTRATAHFRMLTLAATGSKDEAVEQLNLMIEDDHRHQSGSYELLALYHLARLGEPSAPDRLLAVAGGLSGPFTELCTLYGKGIASQDPNLLIQAAGKAKQLGFPTYCSDAADVALTLATDTRDRADCRRMQKSARWALDEISPSANTNRLRHLTAREQEIAAKVAEGHSSKLIASDMFLSVRTIEGHLYRIYAKLSVRNRAQLARVVTQCTETRS
ncbi:helix-turn-helix transcriptional regulator [Arthrobacter castelli]|uniref:helix-turn-helix transcriptional regulator n=1 Tax=Arthrobacter castelli TaxID=271431 RepID=UPI00138B116E|nr:LuxR C-terminal-related transcriptional regulator [Arthrobacter castelli]